MAKAEAISQSSLALFDSHQELKALTEGIKAGKILKEQKITKPLTLGVLQKAVYSVHERNSLEHQNPVKSVVFSPDGQTIASTSDDNMVIFWDWNLDSLMVSACDWARDYLQNSADVEESDRHLCDGISKN
ncbi:MAG: hypothetical protein KAF91_00090 [Nostoc sp. TH1S01]|nr:hypothetical protein [Nostoc sp. TH1S01]